MSLMNVSPSTTRSLPEYAPQWKEFSEMFAGADDFSGAAEKINAWLSRTDLPAIFPKEILSGLNGHPTYLRNSLGRSEGKKPFEALLIYWTKGARTNIHGHPDFAFYRVLRGRFRMHLYETIPGNAEHLVREKEVVELSEGQSRFSMGAPGRFDNFIHLIECLEPGFTFHFYSDDAQKGESFSLVRN
ncbi:MAG: hypothetical protein JNM63_17460 [Spirochaetia bacterium]|nr:hypothetical protein [Spirochaetia bacterium]